MKKSFYYYIGVCLMCSLAWGCTSEVDEVFEQNASQRLDNMTQECMDLLTAAPNGWVIEYYPDEHQSYGGYIFLADFEKDGNVTVAGGMGEPDERATSHYSLLASNSVVLSFDTYNSLFHYFSDPDVGSGTSLKGDFEFIYQEGQAAQIKFTGTKTGNAIVFKALDAGVDWTQYLTGINNMEKALVRSPYIGFAYQGAGGTTNFEWDTANRSFVYAPDGNQPDNTVKVAYCYTPDGLNLYTPVRLGSVEAQTFKWDEAAQQLVCMEESNVIMDGTVSEAYVPYDTFLGNWYMTYNAQTKPVQIVPKEEGISFTLKGLEFDLELEYSKRTGSLSLTTQEVGRLQSYYVYFCPWDAGTGYLSWGPGYGFNLVYNGDADNPELIFEDNGKWAGATISSFLFYAFTSPGPNGTVGAVVQYPYVESLHK